MNQRDISTFLDFSPLFSIEYTNKRVKKDRFSLFHRHNHNQGGYLMDCKDLKKLLAGLGVAGLISAGGVTLPGAHAAGNSG